MRKRLHITILLLITLCVCSFSNHPIKLTSSIIRYNKSAQTLKMECKVFIDDFAPAINPTLEKHILEEKVTKDDISGIENYFITNYKIYINDKKLGLKLVDYKAKKNVMTISFAINNYQTPKKGDRIKVENELLFEKFPDIQSNWVTLQIPPFLKNYNFESNFENYSFTRIF